MFEIKTAAPADIPLIRTLCLQVWPQTYAAILTPAQIDYMLELMYSETALASQMDGGATFLLLYEANEPVGYAAFEEQAAGIFKLQKLYVLPAGQGKGRGRYLLEYIVDACKKRGGRSLELQVNRNNRARFFYEKLGFTVQREADFPIGNGYLMEDYVMERKLD